MIPERNIRRRLVSLIFRICDFKIAILKNQCHDIYIKRIGFSLIRVHRFQANRVNTSTENLLMSQLKWPIETIYTGLRPAYNVDAANPNQARDWHRLTLNSDETVSTLARSESKFFLAGTAANAGTLATLAPSLSVEPVDSLTYAVSQKTIQRLKVTAHGINIYDDFDSTFFSTYTPWHYGGWNIVTPEDEGALMVNFCLYPGTYQPSGHLNVSRAREFYIQYTCPSAYVINGSNPADLLTLAIAINFLLISDGSAVLRYST